MSRPKLPEDKKMAKIILSVPKYQQNYVRKFFKQNQDIYTSQAHITRTALDQFITNNPLKDTK